MAFDIDLCTARAQPFMIANPAYVTENDLNNVARERENRVHPPAAAPSCADNYPTCAADAMGDDEARYTTMGSVNDQTTAKGNTWLY
jgi:hypothetical protein